MPFIQRRRFFNWASAFNLTPSQTCLKLAMWTVAASLSSQYTRTAKGLYLQTRRALEELELNTFGLDPVDIEQVQAWALVSLYEFLQMFYRRGWLSLGRACRLVHPLGLYKIDCDHNILTEAMEHTPTETEERRRTFWMIYCIDRLVSIRNNWPLNFSEFVVSSFYTSDCCDCSVLTQAWRFALASQLQSQTFKTKTRESAHFSLKPWPPSLPYPLIRS